MNVLFISLGCDKNLSDTEMMLGLVSERGYALTDDESQADIAVINSCCFIGDAKEESINTILETARLKEEGRLKVLIVTGCLSQRYREEIIREIPEVDCILGIQSIGRIADAIDGALKGRARNHFDSLKDRPYADKRRLLTTGGHYAYLKIAEGCSKYCTYCIIPYIRGEYRSIDMDILVQEAADLAEKGVRELILVAQETTIYGRDLYGANRLPDLLKALCAIEGIRWIRLLYCYPEEITDELVQVMKEEPKICHYLDIPIQSASDSVLKRMGRRTRQEELRERIRFLRTSIPDICLRTTFITGFPGESREEFEESMYFINEMEFDRLGAFAYSAEEGTKAAEMDGQIDDEVKNRRRDEMMELQQEIAFELAERRKGSIMDVMIEGKIADEDAYVARSYMDAPGVDGMVFVRTLRDLKTGDFVKVRITGCNEYDLIGEIFDESAQ